MWTYAWNNRSTALKFAGVCKNQAGKRTVSCKGMTRSGVCHLKSSLTLPSQGLYSTVVYNDRHITFWEVYISRKQI